MLWTGSELNDLQLKLSRLIKLTTKLIKSLKDTYREQSAARGKQGKKGSKSEGILGYTVCQTHTHVRTSLDQNEMINISTTKGKDARHLSSYSISWPSTNKGKTTALMFSWYRWGEWHFISVVSPDTTLPMFTIKNKNCQKMPTREHSIKWILSKSSNTEKLKNSHYSVETRRLNIIWSSRWDYEPKRGH